MKALFAPVMDMAGMEQIKHEYETLGNVVMVSGCVDTQKVHFAEAVGSDYRYRKMPGSLMNLARFILQKISYSIMRMSMVIR